MIHSCSYDSRTAETSSRLSRVERAGPQCDESVCPTAGPPVSIAVLAGASDPYGPALERSLSHIGGPRTISVHARYTDASRRTRAEPGTSRRGCPRCQTTCPTPYFRTRYVAVGQVSWRTTTTGVGTYLRGSREHDPRCHRNGLCQFGDDRLSRILAPSRTPSRRPEVKIAAVGTGHRP